MKKYVWMVALFAALAMVFTGCGGGSSDDSDVLTVTFAAGIEGEAPAAVSNLPGKQLVNKGDVATRPAAIPTTTDEDTVFADWTDAEGASFDFDTPINEATTVYAKWNKLPPQRDVDIRLIYTNGTFLDIPFTAGDTTWANILASDAYILKGRDIGRGFKYEEFKAWKDQSGKEWTNGNDVINSKLTLRAAFLSTVFTGDKTGATQVYLENSGYVVYEFTLPNDLTAGAGVKAELAKIKGIKADYGLSEEGLAVYKDNGRAWRAFGPYFFNSSMLAVDDLSSASSSPYPAKWQFYGDFVRDQGNALVARLDGTASKPEKFNKFHSYMVYSAGGYTSATDSWSAETSPAPAANTWFTTTYTFSSADDGKNPGDDGYAWQYGKTLRLLDGVLTDGKDNGVQVIPANTFGSGKKTVYFAIGLTRANKGNGNGKDGSQSPWDSGIISFVKNVKLIYAGDDGNIEIPGVIPSLRMGTAVATGVFNGYVDPKINYNWTGPTNFDVYIKPDPSYVPPVEIPQATTTFVVDGATLATVLKIHQNEKGKPGTTGEERPRIVIAGDTVTFDLDADDKNQSGNYGGGGFKILFADLTIPAPAGVAPGQEYLAYKNIILNVTITDKSATEKISNKQIIFANVDSDILSVGGSGNDQRYITAGSGTKEYKISSGARGNMMQGATGISVRANNWSEGDFHGTIKVNKLTFSVQP